MPAAAGAVRVPYRTFTLYNVTSGIVWGVGYCLLGYLAGSAYTAIEKQVGTGLAIAVAVIVVAAVAVFAIRRHRAGPARAGVLEQAMAPGPASAAGSASAAGREDPPGLDGAPADGDGNRG